MFAIGSMLFASISAVKSPQDWLCVESHGACYFMTDDVANVKHKNPTQECSAENPNLSIITSHFVDSHIIELCGCEYCEFSSVTYPSVSGSTPSEEEEPTDIHWYMYDEAAKSHSLGPTDMDYVIIALMNLIDMNNFIPLKWESEKFTMSVCSKPMNKFSTALATCEPLIHCKAAQPCLAKEKKAEADRVAAANNGKGSNKASNDLKSLWGLLFLPGFLVGVCAAYCFYRHRRNTMREAVKRQDIEVPQNTHIGVQQNVPVQQTKHDSPNVQYIPNGHRTNGQQKHDNVPHAVSRPQMA